MTDQQKKKGNAMRWLRDVFGFAYDVAWAFAPAWAVNVAWRRQESRRGLASRTFERQGATDDGTTDDDDLSRW